MIRRRSFWLAVGLCGVLLALCGVSVLAEPGLLRTTGGRNLKGDVSLETGGFKVTVPNGQAERVELARVALVQMENRGNKSSPTASLKGNGLLAEYFDQPDLTGTCRARIDERIDFHWGDSRPMEGMPADDFSVRWSGQLAVPKSGDYTFHVQSDDGVRLWIEGRALIDEWKPKPPDELHARRRLEAGRTYDFKLEYFEREHSATIKLAWEGPDLPRGIVPRECFSTTNLPARTAARRETTLSDPPRRGVVLADGSFLAHGLKSLEDDRLELWAGGKVLALPLSQVARIQFWDLTPDMHARVRRGQPGVLLGDQDFVDGEIRSLSERRVRVSSVLWGLKSYETSGKVAAVVFREPRPRRTRFEVRLRNGSCVRTDALECGQQGLIVKEGPLSGLKVPTAELLELRTDKAEDAPGP